MRYQKLHLPKQHSLSFNSCKRRARSSTLVPAISVLSSSSRRSVRALRSVSTSAAVSGGTVCSPAKLDAVNHLPTCRCYKPLPFTLCSHNRPDNLIFRAVEFEIIPFCRANGIGVIAYSPLMQVRDPLPIPHICTPTAPSTSHVTASSLIIFSRII